MICAGLLLAGCGENGTFSLAGAAKPDGTGSATRTIERDVEAPEIYQVSDRGLWDGRPSLGGVWVAEPDVSDPERVIIRNEDKGTFVIGALFRRERDAPGPQFQVSSDAAEALGMVAGSPANLNVTALRKQEIVQEPEPTATPVEGGEISEESLDDPIAGTAAAAIATAEAAAAEASAATPTAPASTLQKPYTQIGIFSVEANARNTAASLRNAGLVPTVLEQSSRGKAFWRVIVGPSTTTEARKAVLDTVKGLGFTDAYFVTN